MKNKNIAERIEFILSCMPLRKRVIVLQALLEAAERRVAAQRAEQEDQWRDEAREALDL